MLFIFKDLTDIVNDIREVRLLFIYLSKLFFFYANKLYKTFDNPILIIFKLPFVGLGVKIMAVCQLISLDVLVPQNYYISWTQHCDPTVVSIIIIYYYKK